MTLAVYGELTPEHPPLGKWLIGAADGGARLRHPGRGGSRLSGRRASCSVALLFVLVKRAVWPRPRRRPGASAVARGRLSALHPLPPRGCSTSRGRCSPSPRSSSAFSTASRSSPGPREGALARRWRLAAGVAGGAAAACEDLRRRRRLGRAPARHRVGDRSASTLGPANERGLAGNCPRSSSSSVAVPLTGICRDLRGPPRRVAARGSRGWRGHG